MGNNLHDGHRERTRRRYIGRGLECFDDHQVLELLLFYCIPRRDTNELAHKMINEYGSLHNLFEATPSDIMAQCHVGEPAAVLISMIPSLARRYFGSKFENRTVLDSSKKIGQYAVSLLAGQPNECLYCICLDHRRRLIAAPRVSEGTVNETQIFPRQVAAAALKNNAVSIVLAHNHPSGLLEPSRDDIFATIRIKDALEPLQIDILDHIIIGGDKYFSFAEANRAELGINNMT